MAFLNTDFGNKYIDDFYHDRIKSGEGIDIKDVDKHVSFKQGQYNIVIGVDNVGKTDFLLWYYLVLALKHEKSFCIWSGENKPEQQKRKLMQMYAGKSIKDMTYKDVQKSKLIIENYFTWIDRNVLYDHNQLLDMFNESEASGFLIDPINGLDHKLKFGTTDMTYKFSNDIRQFCNNTNKTVFVSAHTVTEAARRTYPKEHELFGYQMPPIKSMIEGGQPFASRADDFWVVNRLINHDLLKFYTQLEIQKVKDTETGGEPTMKDKPLCFEYNFGLGFRYSDIDILNPHSIGDDSIDPLDGLRMNTKAIVKPLEEPKQMTIETAIKPNLEFDKPKEVIKPKVNNEPSEWLEENDLWD